MPYLQAMPDAAPADRPRVFVTRRLPGDAVERLSRDADVDLRSDELPPPYDELSRRAAAAGFRDPLSVRDNDVRETVAGTRTP